MSSALSRNPVWKFEVVTKGEPDYFRNRNLISLIRGIRQLYDET